MKLEHSWSLGALCLAVALWLPSMASAGSYGASLGEIYLSIDPLVKEQALIDQPMNTPFNFYLVADADYGDLGEPDVNGLNGIWAWEARVDIPAAITITARPTTEGSVNVGQGSDNFIVGISDLLALGVQPVTLVTYEAILLTAVQDEILTIAPSDPSTFDDVGSIDSGPGWLEYMPLGDCDYISRRPGSGCLRAFAEWGARLVINCVAEDECFGTAAEQGTWGAVKSRFARD